MPISSTNGYITVGEDENVNIVNDIVEFNEFSQANININYTATVARAKTTFRITELDKNGKPVPQSHGAPGNISQVSYRNDVVRGDGSLQVQFTGGSAILYIQSAVGRTTNISRGIIGAPGKRPTGEFRIQVDLLASTFPSGAPELIDSIIINGRIKPVFTQPLVAILSQERGRMKYSISLSEEDSLSHQFLYGYKIKNIAQGIVIHKGRTTVFNNDIFQVSGPSFEITSCGGNGSVAFDVISIDIDKQERCSRININTFDFSQKPITVSYPLPTDPNDKSGFVKYFSGGSPTNYAIYSASDRTTFEQLPSSGTVRLSLPDSIPSSNSQLEITIKTFDKNSNPKNIVTVNNLEFEDGVLEIDANINSANNFVDLNFVSKNYENGRIEISCKITRSLITQTLTFNETLGLNNDVLTLLLVENIPEADGIPKRVYLHDNTIEYTIDPCYDDSADWTTGANTIDGLTTGYCNDERVGMAKYINNDNQSHTFNLQYGDHNSEAKANFGTFGDLDLHIKWDSLIVRPDCEAPNSCEFRLAVNPETYDKFGNNTCHIENDHTGIKTDIIVTIDNGFTTTTTNKYNIAKDGTETLIQVEEGSNVVTRCQRPCDVAGTTTTYERLIGDNVMIIRSNGFYGCVKLIYDLTEKKKEDPESPDYVEDYKSFRSVTSRIYLMPKVDPIVKMERYTKHKGESTPELTNDTDFSICDYVKYLITVKNANCEAYDYICAEHNKFIRAFLKSQNKLRVRYEDAISSIRVNDRLKSELISNEVLRFESEDSFVTNNEFREKREECILSIYKQSVLAGLGLVLSGCKYHRSASCAPSYDSYVKAFNDSIDKAITKALENGAMLSDKHRCDIIGSAELLSEQDYKNTFILAPFDPKCEATQDASSQKAYKIYLALLELFKCQLTQKVNDPESTIYERLLEYIPVKPESLPYAVNGYDELDWMRGESKAWFEFNPIDGVSGEYKLHLKMKFTSLTDAVDDVCLPRDIITIYADNKDVFKKIMTLNMSVLHVPLVMGYEVEDDCSLIRTDSTYLGWSECEQKSPVDSCTTVVIKNISADKTISVTTTDFTKGEGDNNAIYVSNSPGTVSICPGKSRVFIRIMYSPAAWEPSCQEF